MENTKNTEEFQKKLVKNLFDFFDLNNDDVNDFLIKYNGMIAGSAPLNCFIELYQIPGDIDFWVQVKPYVASSKFYEKTSDIDMEYSIKNEQLPEKYKVFLDFEELLYKGKYKRDYESHLENNEYSDGKFLNIVYKIVNFKNNINNKIQLILTYVDQKQILESFDLSFCATSWNGKKFYSLNEELTKNKIGYRLRDEFNEREKLREQKYISKGFKMIENPSKNSK